LQALRQRGASAITVAVPVAPRDTVQALEREGVRVVCLTQPDPFVAVGLHYRHFPQVEDEEVMAVLQRARAG
jgi:putative phosphoribosyl transferase